MRISSTSCDCNFKNIHPEAQKKSEILQKYDHLCIVRKKQEMSRECPV
jgi:hypothetical protein